MKLIFDSGHTADRAREYPEQFTGVDWTKGKAAEVARVLGFTVSTADSVEHMFTVALVRELVKASRARGIEALAFDRPGMKNDAEISAVVEYVNAQDAAALVSIHADAAGANGWRSMACAAAGSVVLHYQGSKNGERLAQCVAARLKAYRRVRGGPDNRAESARVRKSSVAVLRKTRPVAVLVEACFYDNLEDLHFSVTHLNGLANAVLDGVVDYVVG